MASKVEESPMKPSADMLRNAQVALAVRWYMKKTAKLALALKEMFRAAYPDEFKIYEKAFEAGVWEAADPGPWLGRAIVWKLNVLPHRDGLDGGPTAIFCLGRFSGGEAYLTDLKLKLWYISYLALTFRLCLVLLLGIARAMFLFLGPETSTTLLVLGRLKEALLPEESRQGELEMCSFRQRILSRL